MLNVLQPNRVLKSGTEWDFTQATFLRVKEPINGKDAVNKEYADQLVSGNLTAIERISMEMQFDVSNPAYYTETEFDSNDDPETKTIYDSSAKTTTLYTIEYDFTVTDIITKTITRISDSQIMTIEIDMTTDTIIKTVTIN